MKWLGPVPDGRKARGWRVWKLLTQVTATAFVSSAIGAWCWPYPMMTDAIGWLYALLWIVSAALGILHRLSWEALARRRESMDVRSMEQDVLRELIGERTEVIDERHIAMNRRSAALDEREEQLLKAVAELAMKEVTRC